MRWVLILHRAPGRGTEPRCEDEDRPAPSLTRWPKDVHGISALVVRSAVAQESCPPPQGVSPSLLEVAPSFVRARCSDLGPLGVDNK